MTSEENPASRLQRGDFKDWAPSIWIKCIQGIVSSDAQAKGFKSAFDGGRPDLQEDHLKLTLSKESHHYEQMSEMLKTFAELQSDFKVTPHSLQKAANFHKVDKDHITKFLELLNMKKPMDSASKKFLGEYGARVFVEDKDSVQGEYKYVEDTALASLGLELRATTLLRDHQKQALLAVFPPDCVPRIARSGILEMPCGSGKTLTGIAIACKIEKPTLVLCNNSDAVDHWRSEFLRFSNISEQDITRATGEIKEKMFRHAGVYITTYQMLSNRSKSAHSQYHIQTAKSRYWGCVLYDEVHHLPAAGNSVIASLLQAKCKIGLTGTYNREDKKISELDTLVGPCLYRTNLQFLREQQLVANIMLKQLLCDMTPDFMRTYNCIRGKSAHRVRSILSVLSPHKFHTVLSLIKKHEAQVLFQTVTQYRYSTRLSKDFISGDTDKQSRDYLFNQFLTGNKVNTLLITRTGDESLNLPIANVVIQTSFHHGANNQEMQRLGRILRPKGGASKGEIEGVFYSLVSKDTREMVYAKKRRKLVISDGVDYLEELAVHDPSVHFSTPREQEVQLQAILAAYATSSYLDTATPSDHAKKVQQELTIMAKQKTLISKNIIEQGETDKSEQDETDESEDDEEDESKKEVKEKENKHYEELNNSPKQPEEEINTTTTESSTPSSKNIQEISKNKEVDTLSGKKRNEPEVDPNQSTHVPSVYANFKKVQVSAKKEFLPNINLGKRNK